MNSLGSSENLATNGHIATRDCWPATLRDWLTAHSCVRLGRLDRFDAIRKSRDNVVKILARTGQSIRFDTGWGFEIFLPAFYRGIVIMALKGVLFHSALVEVMSRAIRPGDIVVDGGSNVGFLALLAATKLRGSGRVIAFEPDPNTFLLLQTNIRHNGFSDVIRAERLALTDNEGMYDFSVDTDEPMLSSLIPRQANSSPMVRVKGVRLDGFLAASGLERADIIKLDLEGAEPMALEGACAVLPTARMLVFETNEPQLKQLGVEPVALVERTAAAGRFDTIFFIDERSENKVRWEPRDFEEALHAYKFINVVCTRSNSTEKQQLPGRGSVASSGATETFRW
jgi:FkbM family methyltransferase